MMILRSLDKHSHFDLGFVFDVNNLYIIISKLAVH